MGTKTVAKPLRAAQSGSEPEKIGLAPEPEPLHQLSRWSRAVSGPSRAVTTLPVIHIQIQVLTQTEPKRNSTLPPLRLLFSYCRARKCLPEFLYRRLALYG